MMKKIILILSIVLMGQMYGQDPMLQNDHPKLEEVAYEITREYNKQLALDGDQVILFQKKVEEFLIRRKEIEKEFSGKEKLTALLNMQTRETAEMNDILTRPQLDLYKKIKPDLQPLEVVNQKEQSKN